MTSRPLLPLLYLQCPAPTGVSFTPFSLVPSLLTPNPSIPQRLGLVTFSLILFLCPWLEEECEVLSGGKNPPRRWPLPRPPLPRPSRVPVAALPGRMVGTCCSSGGSAVSCKKEAAAAAGAGGGGGEEPDLSGSEGLEANTELPQSRPGAGRAPLPRGALPAGRW